MINSTTLQIYSTIGFNNFSKKLFLSFCNAHKFPLLFSGTFASQGTKTGGKKHCSTGGVYSLAKSWARCHGPRACFSNFHPWMGRLYYSNFDFHKGAHLGSCGLTKANFW